MPIDHLPNLGPYSAKVLEAAGIETEAQLRQLGPVRAFLAAKQTDFRPSLNLLWALAGALTNRKWTEIQETEKQGLLAEMDSILNT